MIAALIYWNETTRFTDPGPTQQQKQAKIKQQRQALQQELRVKEQRMRQRGERLQRQAMRSRQDFAGSLNPQYDWYLYIEREIERNVIDPCAAFSTRRAASLIRFYRDMPTNVLADLTRGFVYDFVMRRSGPPNTLDAVLRMDDGAARLQVYQQRLQACVDSESRRLEMELKGNRAP